MNLKQGTLLQGGKYRIVRFISSGGFGCTYEAEHVMLGERVAIKEFFVKDFCNRDEATAHVTVGTQSKKGLVDKLKHKFVEEAKMLYRMQHSGIVRVFDIFEENCTAYFVMDYIEGHSLSEIVAKEGPLNEARAIKYIRQIAEALKYVHERDRLHLDIKPGNIMINQEDQAILIDFGASKQYDEQDGENTSTLIGKTPGYAPLEQMGNDVVKFLPATDIYALAATLYKLLTGITPLSANLLASGEELEPLPASISQATRKAVEEAMRINKNKRTQTIEAFLALLDAKADETTEKISRTEETLINTPIEPATEHKKIPHPQIVKPIGRQFVSMEEEAAGSNKKNNKVQVAKRERVICICAFILVGLGILYNMVLSVINTIQPSLISPKINDVTYYLSMLTAFASYFLLSFAARSKTVKSVLKAVAIFIVIVLVAYKLPVRPFVVYLLVITDMFIYSYLWGVVKYNYSLDKRSVFYINANIVIAIIISPNTPLLLKGDMYWIANAVFCFLRFILLFRITSPKVFCAEPAYVPAKKQYQFQDIFIVSCFIIGGILQTVFYVIN